VQDVKVITEKLKSKSCSDWEIRREVHRPWGKYNPIDMGDRYQVERFAVMPGTSLVCKWIIIGLNIGLLFPVRRESPMVIKRFYFLKMSRPNAPNGVVHALENLGKVELELIDVQSGSFLGEGDIVRFEDNYGRVDFP
jgi:mannose-6-phosphate isomerase-like protein (cupin superfamily)